MLRIYDSRRGSDFEFKFDQRTMLKISDIQKVVVVSVEGRYDRPHENVAKLAYSLWSHRGYECAFLHIAPSPYRKSEAHSFPDSWMQLFATNRAWMFGIQEFDLDTFSEYFARTSSHEGWMLYFLRQDPGFELSEPCEDFGFSNTIFTNPLVPWDILMFYDGEFGNVLIVLPTDESTDDYLAKLVESRQADWAAEKS